MPNNKDTLEHVKTTLEKVQFNDAFAKGVAPFMKSIISALKEANAAVIRRLDATDKRMDDRLDTIEARANAIIKGKDGYAPRKGKDYFDGRTPTTNELINLILPLIPKVQDGKTPTESELLALIKVALPTQFDISAIKGLDDELRNAKTTRVQTPAKAYRIHTADITSQCNGVNKTFSVGGTHFGIISVSGTQFPLIYRPIIDYTETATGFQLTSAVAAPDTGQTVVATFLK